MNNSVLFSESFHLLKVCVRSSIDLLYVYYRSVFAESAKVFIFQKLAEGPLSSLNSLLKVNYRRLKHAE